jgi:uncharacterized protein YkwD
VLRVGRWSVLMGVGVAMVLLADTAAFAEHGPGPNGAAMPSGRWAPPGVAGAQLANPAQAAVVAQLVLRSAAQELGVYRSAAHLVARRVAERRAAEEAAAAAHRAAEEAALAARAAEEAARRAEVERQAAEAAREAARAEAARATAEAPSPPPARPIPRVAPTPAPASPPGPAEVRFLALVNETRGHSGVGALAMDGRLQASAQGWARQLAQDATLHHQDVGQFLDAWTTAGENVAFGPNVDALFGALVASPRHYANIVRPQFSAVGIGVVVGSDGQLWTSHVFAG